MGSTFLTIGETANRLNVSKRTVHNYIDKGFLRRLLRDGKVYLSKEEVEQLAVDLGSDFPALTRKNMYDVTRRLRQLEEKMAVMEQVWATWGVQDQPMRPDNETAAKLYDAATGFLTVSRWPLEVIESWTKVFNQMDETFLESISVVAKTPQPWLVFYQLATKMLEFVTQAKETKSSLLLQALQTKLQMGRRKVREEALFWMESGRGLVQPGALPLPETPQEELLRHLPRKNGK